MEKLIKLCFVALLLSSCEDNSLRDSVKEDYPFQLELERNKGENEKLQHADFIFTVTNISNKTVSYGFPSSCQSGYTVERNGKLIFDSRSNFLCLAVITVLELAPGERQSYPISLRYLESRARYIT